jgi:hypothetical protein
MSKIKLYLCDDLYGPSEASWMSTVADRAETFEIEGFSKNDLLVKIVSGIEVRGESDYVEYFSKEILDDLESGDDFRFSVITDSAFGIDPEGGAMLLRNLSQNKAVGQRFLFGLIYSADPRKPSDLKDYRIRLKSKLGSSVRNQSAALLRYAVTGEIVDCQELASNLSCLVRRLEQLERLSDENFFKVLGSLEVFDPASNRLIKMFDDIADETSYGVSSCECEMLTSILCPFESVRSAGLLDRQCDPCEATGGWLRLGYELYRKREQRRMFMEESMPESIFHESWLEQNLALLESRLGEWRQATARVRKGIITELDMIKDFLQCPLVSAGLSSDTGLGSYLAHSFRRIFRVLTGEPWDRLQSSCETDSVLVRRLVEIGLSENALKIARSHWSREGPHGAVSDCLDRFYSNRGIANISGEIPRTDANENVAMVSEILGGSETVPSSERLLRFWEAFVSCMMVLDTDD